MKLNLDGQPRNMGVMLNAAFQMMAENPTQEEGSQGAVLKRVSGVNYEFVKNQDSYTIREV